MSYNKLRAVCERNSHISEQLISNFLIPYTARYKGLEKKLNQQFRVYSNVIDKFDNTTVNFFKSQCLIHKAFKEDGLIHKFLKYPAFQRFKGDERKFLLQSANVPWQYSFAEIIAQPEKDFFMMRDAFIDMEYLLFSPAMTTLNAHNDIILWSNLIGFNGSCWQSFGPIGAFKSFGADEIFIYAMEYNHSIEDFTDVYNDIEDDPMPYMLLISGANYPRIYHGKDELIQHMSEHPLNSLQPTKLKSKFESEYFDGVYRCVHRKIGEHPHFAEFYYDERLQAVAFYAMTERGFKQLMKDFNSFGYNYPVEPFFSIRKQIIPTAEEILQIKIELNDYQDHFESDSDPEDNEMLQKMNQFMGLLLPDFNAGKMPDIEAAAKKAGLPLEAAEDLFSAFRKKFDEMPGSPTTPKATYMPSPEMSAKTKNLTANTWNSIYQSAREIKLMQPWKKLHETDVFGIRIPGTDRIYFISVMGSNTGFFAIAAYIGYEGFFKFFELEKMGDKSLPTAVLTIPYLMLSFVDRGELEKEDLEAIKKSKESFSGKKSWPRLSEIVPGFVPTFPEGESLSDLPVLFEQALWVLSKAVIDPDFLNYGAASDAEVYVRTPTATVSNPKWNTRFELPEPKKFPIKFDIQYSHTSAAKVSKKKVSDLVLQIDLVLLPKAVKEQGVKAHFPFAILFVDKASGVVAGMSLLAPVPNLQSMYELVPEKLLEKLGEMEYRPACIEMRPGILYNIAEKVLNVAWCKTKLQEEMPVMDEAIDSLMQNLNQGT